MTLLLCAMLAGGTQIVDPLAPYRGVPIVRVDVIAAGEDIEELRRLIGIETGYLYNSADVETALKRLYALGRFTDVGVRAERLSGSLVLHFYMRPLVRLGTLSIVASGPVDIVGLQQALLLETGDEVDRRTKALLEQRTLAFMRDSGFPRPEVKLVERQITPSTRDYDIQLRAGRPRLVRAIRFTGTPGLKNHVLASFMHTRIGRRLDVSDVNDDRGRVLLAYLEAGYRQARVGEPVVSGDEESAEVTMEVHAGPRIAIYLHGNHVVEDAVLFEMAPPKNQPLEERDLRDFTYRITERYRRLGYHHAQVTVRGIRGPGEGEIRYVMMIDEGKPQAVAKLDFSGNTIFESPLLERQVHSTLTQELTGDIVFQRLDATDRANLSGEAPHPRPKVVPVERRYIPEIYDKALDQIAAAYKNRGYLDVEVGPVQVEEKKDGLHLHVPIKEGPETRVRSVTFRDNQAFESSELLTGLEEAAAEQETGGLAGAAAVAVPGAPYSSSGAEDARISIVRRYRDQGYLYMRLFSDVHIEPDPSDPKRAWAEVSFRFEEGPQVRIASVIVRGNQFTREGLIADRMSLKVGEVYRLEQALQDQRNIAALGVFSSVRVKLIDEEIPAERKDVVAEVVERNRQSVEPFAGVSTADGPRVGVQYTHLNVAGTAAQLNLSLKLNWQVFFGLYGKYGPIMEERYDHFDFGERTELEARAGIRSPPLLSLPLDPTLRFDLVGERENAIPYSLQALRAIFGIDLRLHDRLGMSFEPQVELTGLRCYDTALEDGRDCASEAQLGSNRRQPLDEGVRAMVKVGPSITYDLRDDPFTPTRGFYATLRTIYAWGRAQDFDEALQELSAAEPFTFTKFDATLSGYFPLPAALVLALSAQGGSIFNATGVPPDQRFYLGGLGGADSHYPFRGFVDGSLVPDDVCVQRADAEIRKPQRSHCTEVVNQSTGLLSTGGHVFTLLRAELRLPVRESVSLGLFGETGNLWLEAPEADLIAMRVTTGVGLRYVTPVGPLGLDLGFNPDPKPLKGEQDYDWYFAVGVF